MFFVLSRTWDKEKVLSSREEWNLRPSVSALRYSTTEPQRLLGGRGPLRSSYMTRVLHTARMSTASCFFLCHTLVTRRKTSSSMCIDVSNSLKCGGIFHSNFSYLTLKAKGKTVIKHVKNTIKYENIKGKYHL